MAIVQGLIKTSIVCDILLVWRTITDFVTAKTSKTRGNYWGNGHSTTHSSISFPTLAIYLPANAASSSPLLHQYSVPGITVSEIRSKFNLSQMHSLPSPRTTNWLENRFLFIKWRENKLCLSKDS